MIERIRPALELNPACNTPGDRQGSGALPLNYGRAGCPQPAA